MFLPKMPIFSHKGDVQCCPLKQDALVKITMKGRSHIMAIYIHALAFYHKLGLIGSWSQLSNRAKSYGR